MPYRLALLSPIACLRHGGTFETLDLWHRDLEAQLGVIDALLLLAPIIEVAPKDDVTRLPLPPSIHVVDPSTVDDAGLDALLRGVDVVQLPGNDDWRRASNARRVLASARRARRVVVLGISSNRARTARLNARGAGPVARLRALARSLSVSASQAWLGRRSDGIFVVGEGLRGLAERFHRNVHVGTASWIRRSDLRDEASCGAGARGEKSIALAVAARLEPMKGVHLAIEALRQLGRGPRSAVQYRLQIAGQGAQEGALRAAVRTAGLEAEVDFIGTLPYPEPFFAWLRGQDLALLTNLNDEQPRLVFDAIAQGAIPLCPDTAPYRGLNLPAAVLYGQGDASALAEAILRMSTASARHGVRSALRDLACEATIETMHARRAAWIASILARTSG